ncbi:MAG TPA: DUF402 domain-containing protein [Chloroflexi bacterium]|nr:DUF402 domain-containing protein [Chloroflexota bacterium]HPO57482.1 DUF402 domain-containing protein [Anaerolineaceae bacterium]
MNAGDPVVVIKQNLAGEETWRYSGRVLRIEDHSVIIEAPFNRPDSLFHGLLFRENDRFVETFYTDRWFNIFEIHDRDDDRIKGWYCNITRPAVIEDGRISYVDLALDLLVYPDGRQLLLDEDEFEALGLDEDTRRKALEGLAQLRWMLRQLG